jgi:hypothetical protein
MAWRDKTNHTIIVGDRGSVRRCRLKELGFPGHGVVTDVPSSSRVFLFTMCSVSTRRVSLIVKWQQQRRHRTDPREGYSSTSTEVSTGQHFFSIWLPWLQGWFDPVRTIHSVDGTKVLFIFYSTTLPFGETVWSRIVGWVLRNES